MLKHEFTIAEMAKSIQVLAETTKDSNIKLGEIAKSMSKQELILEKLTNLEGNTKESINRIHKRIDGFEQQMKDIICVGEKDGCTALKIFKEQEKTTDADMRANIKSNQKRLDDNDGYRKWLIFAVFGAIVSAIMNLILK
ncbi:MAG: hypothetical protein RBR93_12840 [Aliarcobacter butzleri]|nr:hypothetical protein [Aliarcobacter butzleri]